MACSRSNMPSLLDNPDQYQCLEIILEPASDLCSQMHKQGHTNTSAMNSFDILHVVKYKYGY